MDKEQFWDSRAQLGFKAGTNDILAKKLEINAISTYISNSIDVLDIGCGNATTMLELSKKFDIHITGIDFSRKMIDEAIRLSKENNLENKLTFYNYKISEIKKLNKKFDIIYSERSLINLSTWKEQKDAIISITKMLKDNGKYIMCEASQDGLAEINALRKQVNLDEIIRPWHNRYFYDDEIAELSQSGLVILEEINNFSSTYYFLSRVINAAVAAKNNEEPDYNSVINNLALSLPALPLPAQNKIWVWKSA